MNSNDFNNQNPDLINSKGFNNYNNNLISSQEILFYYENSRFLWRELMKINTTYILQTKDVSILEPYAENILYSRLNPDDIDLLSKEYIVQLVTLLQLVGQYLIYTQKRLEYENQDLKDKNEVLKENANNNKNFQALIDNLNRQNEEKDFLIKTYQTMGFNKNNRNNRPSLDNDNILRGKKDKYIKTERKLYICKICSGKKFKSQEYLDEHMQRRHYDMIGQDTEREDTGDSYREEFDKKLNSMTEYLTKMIQQNLENNELYLLNRKFENLQNELISQKNQQIGFNSNQINQNRNQINPTNINYTKTDNYKNIMNEVNKLREDFNKGMTEITTNLNNEKNTLKNGENNYSEKINLNKRNNNTISNTNYSKSNTNSVKERKIILEKTETNININTNANVNNEKDFSHRNEQYKNDNYNYNQKREDLKDKEKIKEKEKEKIINDNKNEKNYNNNINNDNKNEKNYNNNINNNDIDEMKIQNDENENKIEKNRDNNIEDKKIDINISINKDEEENQQNILRDNNPNNIDNRLKKEGDEKENDNIYEKEDTKNQSANFNINDHNKNNINELRGKTFSEIEDFKKKMEKRDDEFYKKENEDYEIIEIPSEFNADNIKINNRIENELGNKELEQIINDYEKNSKDKNIEGRDIYQILEIDNILKKYREYMEEKNLDKSNKNNRTDETPGNDDDKINNKDRVFSIKNSDVFTSQVQNIINVDNNPYSSKAKESTNDKANLMQSSIQLLEQNFELKNDPKKSINQNVIIGHDLTKLND